MPKRNWIVAGCMLCLAALGCRPANDYREPPPPKVTTAHPLQQTLPIFYEDTAETEAANQAEVRSQVHGILVDTPIQSGRKVKVGDVIFRIDKDDYEAAEQVAQAALDTATAAVETANANIVVANAQISAIQPRLTQTEAMFQRIDALLKTNDVSQADWDTAKANRDAAIADQKSATAQLGVANADLATANAKVEAAKADLKQAELNLQRTDVTAKIDGILTYEIREGTLVDSGALLGEIVSKDVIWADFNVSERYLLHTEKVTTEKPDPSKVTRYTALIKRAGDLGYPFIGRVRQAAPQIDQATGTLKVQAEFDGFQNGKELLPGMFVRIRVVMEKRDDAVLIPQDAVVRESTGSFVYVVDSNNAVEKRPVSLGPIYDQMIVVESGLTTNDSIVVSGLQRVRAGDTCQPESTTLPAIEVPELDYLPEVIDASELSSGDSPMDSGSEPSANPTNQPVGQPGGEPAPETGNSTLPTDSTDPAIRTEES